MRLNRVSSLRKQGSSECKGIPAFAGMTVALFFATTVFFLISCGGSSSGTGEDYGDILSSPSGLTLTYHEHKVGWGKSDCTLCHNTSNIHLVDRSGTGIDMAAIRAQVATDGLSSCAICHGDNGINGPTCASCHSNGAGGD